MLYTIGTASEVSVLDGKGPDRVIDEVLRGVCILDAEYGASRDYLTDGGYSLIATTPEDTEGAIATIGKAHPCEWATRIGATGWTATLYILNDDFSVMLYAPESALPTTLLQELEED